MFIIQNYFSKSPIHFYISMPHFKNMPPETEVITVPKKEYEILVRCRHIVESEFEEKFSEEFIKDVQTSEEEYTKGNFVRLKDVKEARKFFD